MKKLLFCCNNMKIGGVQRALCNLLNELADKYSVTLVLFYPHGEYLDELSEKIKIIPANKLVSILGMSQAESKAEGKLIWLWRSLWTVLTRIFGTKFTFPALARMQKIPARFDAAISYMQNSSATYFYGGCNEFVINSVDADEKISFVHCDFERFFGNNAYNRGFYRHFDKIACVSDSCRETFLRVCPEYESKTYSVHNVYDFEAMKKKANEFDAEKTPGAVNIFTAARISPEKGIFRMLDIFEALKGENLKYVWRIAGGGNALPEAAKKAEKKGLSDKIIFLGEKKNPYPYYKAADVVLVPSYDEAAPMVFGEAMCFDVPVVTTDTTSANELVGDRGLGIVIKNDDEKIKAEIKRLLQNPKELFSKKCSSPRDNEAALSEFDTLIGRED